MTLLAVVLMEDLKNKKYEHSINTCNIQRVLGDSCRIFLSHIN